MEIKRNTNGKVIKDIKEVNQNLIKFLKESKFMVSELSDGFNKAMGTNFKAQSDSSILSIEQLMNLVKNVPDIFKSEDRFFEWTGRQGIGFYISFPYKDTKAAGHYDEWIAFHIMYSDIPDIMSSLVFDKDLWMSW